MFANADLKLFSAGDRSGWFGGHFSFNAESNAFNHRAKQRFTSQ